ncbi:MAG TPA: hypothetical protein V6D06_05740 [Trichocoleus sp.]
MRYSIMLQLVALTTLFLVGAAALFAWVQNRPRITEVGEELSSLVHNRAEHWG